MRAALKLFLKTFPGPNVSHDYQAVFSASQTERRSNERLNFSLELRAEAAAPEISGKTEAVEVFTRKTIQGAERTRPRFKSLCFVKLITSDWK